MSLQHLAPAPTPPIARAGDAAPPPLDGAYALRPGQLEAFERDGHLKLSGVFTRDEIEAYRQVLRDLVMAHSEDADPMERKVAGDGKNWRFVDNLWRLSEGARRFVMSPRLGRIAAELMQVDAVRLFRDQSYFKGPQGANTPWHQDAYFMPLDTQKVLTMWIPLIDITPDLAPMSYVTGSNRAGYLGTSVGNDANMDAFEADLRGRGFKVFNYGEVLAGEIAVHSAWTLHSSRTNTSPRMREAMVIVYFADGARLIADPPLTAGAAPQEFYARMIREQNRRTSLPGLKAGDLAAGPMAPLVYPQAEGAS